MANYANIIPTDMSNGNGVRVSIFFSGCTLHCKNCFNKALWDFNYGKEFTNETLNEILKLLSPRHISGLSVLGGEPLQNVIDVAILCSTVKAKYPNKDIWLWTGFTMDDIFKMMNEIEDKTILESLQVLLSNVDYIVAGPFVDEKKDLTLKFRGSSNQHIYQRTSPYGQIQSDWELIE